MEENFSHLFMGGSMQLQGLMFMLFLLLILPILALSTNHFIFFAVMAVILMVSSIKNIYNRFFETDSGEDDEDIEDETEEEFEDLLNLNMKKFGTGIHVVKDLFLILFFVYCSFYLSSILLKIPAALLILIQIHHIRNRLKQKEAGKKEVSPADRNLAVVSGILSLILIGFTACNLLFQWSF